ncbi:MAG: tellurite resistance TerB family protein [Rhodobacteraceae bacterium]|nr:tellurite resistance TerB family protein [Paracoccaceae bacterium]
MALFGRCLFIAFEQAARLFKGPGLGIHRGIAQIGHLKHSLGRPDPSPGKAPCPIARPRPRQYSALQHHAPRKEIGLTRINTPLTAQDALVAIMVAVSASDEHIRTSELVTIERMVNHLPVFADFDADRIGLVARTVLELFEEYEGLDALFGLIREALPEKLFETAYVMACDVAAADGKLGEEELRLLEEIRYELNIDRLAGAAIERAARARHMVL